MVWSALIHDGQVMPTQPNFLRNMRKTVNAEACQFVGFDKGHHVTSPPLANGFEIHAEIAIPRPRHRVRLFLAGAERDPDLSITHL
jgi:hypothetical protein